MCLSTLTCVSYLSTFRITQHLVTVVLLVWHRVGAQECRHRRALAMFVIDAALLCADVACGREIAELQVASRSGRSPLARDAGSSMKVKMKTCSLIVLGMMNAQPVVALGPSFYY